MDDAGYGYSINSPCEPEGPGVLKQEKYWIDIEIINSHIFHDYSLKLYVVDIY